MIVIPSKTYKLLKSINKRNITLLSATEKFGETVGVRIEELLELKFIETVSETDMWQTPIEPNVYKITDSGKAYIQDYFSFKWSELLLTIRNSIIFPVVVSIITTLLTLLLTSLLTA